ncbi:MAG: hypothetical protein RL754_1115 [Bacteroidota bacterium]|jgi:thiol-disulfide isomerase/thioredoxin
MRKIVFSLLVILAGSGLLHGQTVLKGCISNVPDSISEAKIAFLRGQGLAVKEVVPLKKGCFDLNWSHEEKGIFIFYIDGSHTFDFVISQGTVEVEGDYNNLLSAKVNGPGNEEFTAFKTFISQKPEEEAIRSHLMAIENKDLREFLMPQMLPFTGSDNVYWLRAHFWDYTNLESATTLINPFFQKNRELYFDQVLGHDSDTIIYHLEWLFSQPMHVDVKRTLVSAATYHYETSKFMGEDEVFVWLVNAFYKTGFADWVSNEDMVDIKAKADGLASEIIGNPAPRFEFNTRANPKYGWKEGQRIRLDEVKSPITILYFWDSTCGHCKKETPKLKKFYDEYKDKGVEVLTLTLEAEFDSWNKYITEHELDWICGYEEDLSRPNFIWYYYIPATPKKLILDKDKRIIAKNLDAETTLRTFIDDYLAGKIKP